MSFRLFLVLLVFGVLNFYAVTRFTQVFQPKPSAVWVMTLGFFLLQMLAPFGDRLWFPALRKKYNAARLVQALDWVSYLAFGLFSVMLAYAMAADILAIALKMAFMEVEAEKIDRWLYITLVAATLCTAALGIYEVQTGPKVKRVEVKLKNLPAAFDGFTIAQISDLHVGPTIKGKYTRKTVDIANALKPDLIALTGDFVDGTVEELLPDVAPLKELTAPHGVFFVTGNHELYWNGRAWSEAFRRLGARVLENEHEIIRRENDKIVLAGVTDLASGSMGLPPSDPEKAAAGAPADAVKILLCHQPANYRRAREAGFDLQLSGHAHAGQYFPYTLVIRFFQKFYKGLNRYQDLQVYVNSGTGYWGPPFRAGAPAEITLLTLKTA